MVARPSKANAGSGPPQAAVPARPIGPAVPLLFGCAVLASGVATQVLAASFRYHAALGAPIVDLTPAQAFAVRLAAVLVLTAAGVLAAVRWSWATFGPLMGLGLLLVVASVVPIYDPTLGITWGLRLAQQPAYAGLAGRAAVTGIATGGAVFVAGLALLPKAPRRPPTGAFGTARFGDAEPLKGVSGPIIGRDGGTLLRYPGDGHLITFAPTGSGKGIGSVLPNCLTYPGSLVVTDPKGENAAVSARTRREELGQQVAWLDPWRVLGSVGGPVGSDSFNPLDFIDPDGEDANDDAWMIGEQLVPPSYHGSDEGHWLDQARAFLAGLVLHIATRY